MPAGALSRSDSVPNAVLARIQRVIRSVARSVLGIDDPDYEDVQQIAVERLLVIMGEGRPQRGSVVQLAARIARNVAVDVRRARLRWMHLTVRDDEATTRCAESIDPERIAVARELLWHLGMALRAIPPEQAKVVYAHDVLGRDLAEIATIFALSLAAAQSRLFRGRIRMKSLLPGEPDGSDGDGARSGPPGRIYRPARTGGTRVRRAIGARRTAKTRVMTTAMRGSEPHRNRQRTAAPVRAASTRVLNQRRCIRPRARVHSFMSSALPTATCGAPS
jgi:RNA polymerase sigma factor (sigma-70 family)